LYSKNIIEPFVRELDSHLRVLDQYATKYSTQSETTTGTRIKLWLKHGKEFLCAEAIAKELPSISSKIAFSIKTFMVK
jgi:hypothetical protein